MTRSLADLELFYDGAIPAAELARLREAQPPRPALSPAEAEALERRIDAEMDALAAARRERQHLEDLARVAAAESGARGCYFGGTWITCLPARVAEARARIASHKGA